MALYENKVTLKGFIGKDAESKTTKQQRTFVVLSLATKSGYKDRQTNEWVNHTEWHHIVTFGKPAEYAKVLKKGDYVEIEGELRSTEREAEIVKKAKKATIAIRNWEIRASVVRKLAPPTSQTGDNPDAEPVSEGAAA
jgi:single-strand DNA-binding protein